MFNKTSMSIVAAAAVSALSTAACAQTSTVQIYGTMDAGVLSQNRSSLPGNGRVTRVESSGIRPSVLGFKGSEDLGGGLSAFFNLESHIDLDTGAIHGTGDNGTPLTAQPMWRRQANVGLAGNWGSVTIGRQYGPALLAQVATEPRAMKEQFSNLYAWAYNQLETIAGTGAANSNNDVGIFFKNAVQYRATVGPITGGVMYSFGEQANGFSKNSVAAVGLTYTGPVVLSFSHEFMKDQVTAHKVVKHTGIGAAVPFGDFTAKANWLRGDNDSAAGVHTSRVDARSVGVDWRWSGINSATLAYYDNKDKLNSSNHTKNIVVSNDYSFSKRTTLYVQAAYVDASSGAIGNAALKTSIIADASYKAGAKTTFVNVGINHTF